MYLMLRSSSAVRGRICGMPFFSVLSDWVKKGSWWVGYGISELRSVSTVELSVACGVLFEKPGQSRSRFMY